MPHRFHNLLHVEALNVRAARTKTLLAGRKRVRRIGTRSTTRRRKRKTKGGVRRRRRKVGKKRRKRRKVGRKRKRRTVKGRRRRRRRRLPLKRHRGRCSKRGLTIKSIASGRIQVVKDCRKFSIPVSLVAKKISRVALKRAVSKVFRRRRGRK